MNKIGLLDWDTYEEVVNIGKEYTEAMLTDEVIHHLCEIRGQDEDDF